jgi:DNA-binding transcriptional regulator YdaS (Cro superfamily)
MNDGLRLAIEAAGGMGQLGRKLGISAQAVQQWRRVPAHQIVAVEKATGIPREELRPDLYRKLGKNSRGVHTRSPRDAGGGS